MWTPDALTMGSSPGICHSELGWNDWQPVENVHIQNGVPCSCYVHLWECVSPCPFSKQELLLGSGRRPSSCYAYLWVNARKSLGMFGHGCSFVFLTGMFLLAPLASLLREGWAPESRGLVVSGVGAKTSCNCIYQQETGTGTALLRWETGGKPKSKRTMNGDWQSTTVLLSALLRTF